MIPCKIAVLFSAVASFFAAGTSTADTCLEPWSYHQDFESREVSAWASYPLWQDTAYDDNFYAGELVAGDSNISIVQYVKPYANIDTYTGTQKKLDLFLTPSSSISFSYYIKTHLQPEFIKLRIALGDLGKADITVPNPDNNSWEAFTADWSEIIAQNSRLAGLAQLKCNGIAVLVKVPDADPDMPIWFGFDDVSIKASREIPFAFSTPTMHKLPEWPQYIPDRHYKKGDRLDIEGQWALDADRVTLILAAFTDRDKPLRTVSLRKNGQFWKLEGFKLNYDPGLYHGTLTAEKSKEIQADTEFTVYIEPDAKASGHPRLRFDEEKRKEIAARLGNDCKALANELSAAAEKWRTDYPLEFMVYDFDQFPDEDWLITRHSWSLKRVRYVGESARHNALAYSLLDDREAGEYAKNVLLRFAEFPNWNHPWMLKRGRYSYLFIGDMAMDFAFSYDLVHELLDDAERDLIRTAFLNNYIRPTQRTYVEANMVTSNTSNWLAAIMGGSLTSLAAIYGESSETSVMEPCLTGAILKINALVQHAIGSDGGYGEGYGYYAYSSRSWSKGLTALENVFKVDLSARLDGVYDELIWAGSPRKREVYYFGDSSNAVQPMNAWAWLLEKYRDPTLAWYYWTTSAESKSKNHEGRIPDGEKKLAELIETPTLEDLIYDTGSVTAKEPLDENPVRLFRDIGSTVFRGGWEPDDFVFVLRTGAFYNHQHLDQGGFWLADKGQVFMGEHTGSAYYDDPMYETHYTAPVGHSTILIDGNGNGQRTGDPFDFIDGFDDHAFVDHFLDGSFAAFTSGDIGKLYWGKAESIRRNVLYLKPRTLLMLDTVTPGKTDIDVSAIFQTRYLKDILTGEKSSSVTKDGIKLIFRHLYPDNVRAEAVEMPHFFRDYDQKPLYRRGYLSLNARTNGKPLLLANLITTDSEFLAALQTEETEEAVICRSGETYTAFPKNPGQVYTFDTIKSDALVTALQNGTIFMAGVKSAWQDEKPLIMSDEPITVELSGNTITYYLAKESEIKFSVDVNPKTVTIDGESMKYGYDSNGFLTATFPTGEHALIIE